MSPYDPRQQPPATPPPWQSQGPTPPQNQQQPQFRPPQQPPYPPYQYQQPYGPPPRRKSWPARHKGLTVFLSLCGVVTAIAVASAAGSASSTPVPAAGGAATQAAAPAAAKSPAPAAKTVATFTGSGTQNTAKFTVTSTWKLSYSFDCSGFGYAGNFVVSEDGGSDLGGASVDDLAMSKASSTWAYDDAGTHYLAIDSECSWTVKVTDEGA
jgi:hypothetical protein